MLLTEDEARKKECRAGGFLLGLAPILSREVGMEDQNGISWPRCSASDCMTGWRWGWKPKDCPPEKWRGYCGLAGKVEE